MPSSFPAPSGRFRTRRRALAGVALLGVILGGCGTSSVPVRTAVAAKAPAVRTQAAGAHPAKASRSASAVAVRAATVPNVLVPKAPVPKAPDVLVPGDEPVIRPLPTAAAPMASAPQGPSAKEIWADVRARHKAPRAYLRTEPRDVDCLHLKCIALTFDDGPGEGTNKLLEVLAKTGVRATFFVLGRNVKADPAATIRAAWDGHEIGVHTWDHRSLMGRGTEDMATELLRTSDEIARVAGVRPTLMRPPYGDVDTATAKRIRMPVVLWSVDPDDWRDHDPALITQRVVDHAGPGSIVLMHDVYKETEQAVPGIIDHYQRHGYTFVTVSELYASKLKAGRMYHGRELDAAKSRAKDRARGVPEPMPVGPLGTPMDAAAPFPPAPSAVPPTDPAVEPEAPATGDVTEPDPPTNTDPAADPGGTDPGGTNPEGTDPAAPPAPPAQVPPESSAPPAPRGR